MSAAKASNKHEMRMRKDFVSFGDPHPHRQIIPLYKQQRGARSCHERLSRQGSPAELFCNSAAFVQILALSSAGNLTRSIRKGGWCRASGSAGNALYESGDFPRAEQAWVRTSTASHNTPAWPQAVFDLGLLEERQKNFSRAVSYFDAVLKSHPNDKEPGSNTTFGSVMLSPFAQFTLSAHGPTVHPRR